MQEQKFDELERRASLPEEADVIKKMEARSRLHHEMELMKAEGEVLILTPEEEDMLRSFRRFKLRMTKDGAVFSWQTRRPEGVQIVEETANVLHPQEVG